MKKLTTILLVTILICTGCASVNFSGRSVRHHIPASEITVKDNKILYGDKVYAELRFYFTSQLSKNPGEAYLFSAETQHRGLAIYYEQEKELVWIFPEEGRDEDVKRGYFKGRGQTDGYVGWAYDIHISDDGKFVYWKKPGLISQTSYVFSVEHGVSERIKTDWHLW
jgi:hypothetical protein